MNAELQALLKNNVQIINNKKQMESNERDLFVAMRKRYADALNSLYAEIKEWLVKNGLSAANFSTENNDCNGGSWSTPHILPELTIDMMTNTVILEPQGACRPALGALGRVLVLRGGYSDTAPALAVIDFVLEKRGDAKSAYAPVCTLRNVIGGLESGDYIQDRFELTEETLSKLLSHALGTNA